MKNPRKTITYIFLSYLLIFVFGALYIDARQDDLGFLLSIKGYLPWMKYFAILGLVLFLVAYIVVLRDTRTLRKNVNQAKEEHTLLKAKLFDLQEAASKKTSDSAISVKSDSSSASMASGSIEDEEEEDKEKPTGQEE